MYRPYLYRQLLEEIKRDQLDNTWGQGERHLELGGVIAFEN